MTAAKPAAEVNRRSETSAELQRYTRALRVAAECGKALLRAADEADLLNRVCRAVVEIAGYRLAWIGYAEQDEPKAVRPVAHFGFEHGYLESARITWADRPRGRGPIGRAIREAAPIVEKFDGTGGAMLPWQEEAAKRGYAACIGLPLRVGDGVTGVLAVYAGEETAFTADEVGVLTEVAADLSYGITALRNQAERSTLQAELRRSERWLRATMLGSLDAVLLLRAVRDATATIVDFEIIDLNPRVAELLGKSREKLIGRPWSRALHPYSRQLMPRMLAVLQSDRACAEQFELVRPRGDTFWVRHQIVPIEEGIAVLWHDITEEVRGSQLLKANEHKYRELMQSLQEGIWATDVEGRTTFVNEPMTRVLGYSSEEMLGRSIFDFVRPALAPLLRDHHAKRRLGVRESYEFEFRHRNGDPVFLHLEAGPRFDEAGTFLGTMVGLIDVTERRRTHDALRASLERLAKAEELAEIGTWTYDAAAGTMTSSAELQRLFGLSPASATVPLAAALGVFHPGARATVVDGLTASAREGVRRRDELRIVRSDGEERVLLFQSEPIVDETGRVVRVDGFAQDVTERKRNEARLEYFATHDALTDLPNRRVLEDRLAQTITHLERRPGEILGVLFLDLDRFKFVNDSLGHAFGDELLQAVARVLQATVRSGDTVARQGGDEFILLLPDLRQPRDAMVAMEKIQKAFEQPLSIQGRELYVAYSIGASLYPTDGRDVATLLKNADAAMYRAKKAGGGIHFYTRALSEHAAERVQLESDLRRALERGEFELYYQPLVAFAGRRVIGAEALIRWNRPGAGLVLPGSFIPMAEETGLIGSIGEWVLQAACEQAARWRAAGLTPIRIAVNVAASQFHNGRIEDLVTAMASRGDLTTASLELEITERVVMSDAEDAIQRLARLRALGVSLSLDDFGTGYSSLAYLRRLPVDKIKIDQTFVRDLPSGRDAKTLVRAIIDLSHAFGFTVLAEGVETRQQAQFLARQGCEEFQGYYLAKPMPAARFAGFLRESRRLPGAAGEAAPRRTPRARKARR